MQEHNCTNYIVTWQNLFFLSLKELYLCIINFLLQIYFAFFHMLNLHA